MSRRIKLLIVNVADPNNAKNTIPAVTSIQDIGEREVYALPKKKRLLQFHEKLAALEVVQSALRSMKTKRRHSYINLTVTIPEELVKIYFDKEGNKVFEGEFLDEWVEPVKESPDIPSGAGEGSGVRRPMHSIVKDMVLEKFTGKHQNAALWIRTFAMECERLEIPMVRRVEALRLFLEESAATWFKSAWREMASQPWSVWENEFLDIFNTTGWTSLWYVMNFKYMTGPFSDFVIKKNDMLIDADPNLTEISRVGLIVISLPRGTQEKINRAEITTIARLINVLSQSEGFRNKRNVKEGSYNFGEKTGGQKQGQRWTASGEPFCSNCRARPEKVKWHTTANCTYKERAKSRSWVPSDKFRADKGIKMANNVEFEQEMNEAITSPKN